MNIRDAVSVLSNWDDAAWLLLGKGPTLAKRKNINESLYRTMGLNDVGRLGGVFATHIIDWEAFRRCEGWVDDQGLTNYLIMPWYPHQKHKTGKIPLDELCDSSRVLRKIAEDNRLLSYNASTAHNLPKKEGLRVIRSRYFSSVAAFNILAASGVKKIRSLGIDGGTGYYHGFDDDSMKLNNSRNSFDIQFKEINSTARRYGIDFARL